MKDAFEALVESQASYEQFELSADENKESVNTASRGWTPLILVSEKFVDDAPLHKVCLSHLHCFARIARKLVSLGADFSIQDDKGRTAFIHAC